MDFDRLEQEKEIVLRYRQDDQMEPVVLRYERPMPESMREKQLRELLDAGDGPTAVLPPRRRGAAPPNSPAAQKGRRKTQMFVGLALLLALICLGTGMWYVNQNARRTEKYQEGSQDSLPYSGDGYPWVEPDGEGDEEPTIPRYPTGGDTRLGLLSAQDSAVLEPGEVYSKVSPSVVTVMGTRNSYGSVGTGIIFSADGYILTNCHVISGCSTCSVWVTSQEGSIGEYEARLVGFDEDADLAVLKIDASGLLPAEFGVSDELKVGDKVYAIGNPLGLELIGTFTDGMVSAIDRGVDVDGLTMTLIQTNAALNNGNSGGPLINRYGQVVGINTIKMMSSKDTIEGLGFAIPTSIAVGWINELVEHGELSPRPVLGLTISRISTRLPDGSAGLRIESVTPGLGCDRAGIRTGDYIVALGGHDVYSVDQILAIRSTLSVGDQVPVRICRNGQYMDLFIEMMKGSE